MRFRWDTVFIMILYLVLKYYTTGFLNPSYAEGSQGPIDFSLPMFAMKQIYATLMIHIIIVFVLNLFGIKPGELPRIDVDSFPKKTYGVDTEGLYGPMCSICRDDFVQGEKICSYPRCGHLHHILCAQINVDYGNRKCPVCMMNIREDEDEHRPAQR